MRMAKKKRLSEEMIIVVTLVLLTGFNWLCYRLWIK